MSQRVAVCASKIFLTSLSLACLPTRILILTAEDKARAVNGCVSCERLTPCRHCRLTRGLRKLSLLSCNNPPGSPSLQSGHVTYLDVRNEFAHTHTHTYTCESVVTRAEIVSVRACHMVIGQIIYKLRVLYTCSNNLYIFKCESIIIFASDTKYKCQS